MNAYLHINLTISFTSDPAVVPYLNINLKQYQQIDEESVTNVSIIGQSSSGHICIRKRSQLITHLLSAYEGAISSSFSIAGFEGFAHRPEFQIMRKEKTYTLLTPEKELASVIEVDYF
jgi:hypothetical protein